MTDHSNYDFDKDRPLFGVDNLKKKDAAKYLNRIGRGLSCRMDIPVLCIEDVRWAACVFSDLGKELDSIATAKKSEIVRIVSARNAMEGARFKLKLNTHAEDIKKIKKEADKSKYW